MDDFERRVSFPVLSVVLETGADRRAFLSETRLGMVFSDVCGVMSTKTAVQLSLSTRYSSLSPGLTLALSKADFSGSSLSLLSMFESLLLSVKSPCVGIVIVIGIQLENLDSA